MSALQSLRGKLSAPASVSVPILPARLCLHLGVHKTASTHLQAGLAAAAPQLCEGGIAWVGPDAVRAGEAGAHRLVHGWTSPHRARRRLAHCAYGAGTVVISDENLIGTMERNFISPSGPAGIYTDAIDRVSRLVAGYGVPDTRVFLALRHPAEYLMSCFRHLIRRGDFLPWDRFVEHRGLCDVRWLPLLRGIASVPSISKVQVWCYEDWPAVAPAVLAGMLGPDHPPVPLSRRPVNAGWTSDDISEAYRRAGHRPDYRGPGFRPIGPAGYLAASQRYRRELARIGRIERVTLLRPGQAEDA